MKTIGTLVKGTWRVGYFPGKSESHIRHVKVSFGSGASLYL
jgi:hypothetical protein